MVTSKQIVEQAQAWLGRNEKDGSHKLIIDTYNAHKPLARGYKVQYTDEWCATFVSAVSIKCGATDIIPTECSCTKLIELFKALGAWEESDARTPKAGDIIFYDWEDKKPKEENTNRPNHVGIVEKVSGKTITVIEGNKGEAVARRTLEVNGRYIRGYAVPKYAAAANTKVKVELDTLRKGSKGEQVKTLQRLLLALGYKMGNYGVDGSFGAATESAVKAFQKAKGLSADSIVGANTWNKLLKG